MASSTTTRSVSLEHPYMVAGVILVILSLILVAFDLGVLERCGAGSGICLDFGSHALGTGALILFFILFLIGVVLIVYTGESTTVASQTTRMPPPPPPSVTVVTPAAAPAPAPTTVNVTSPPPQNP